MPIIRMSLSSSGSRTPAAKAEIDWLMLRVAISRLDSDQTIRPTMLEFLR